MKKGEYLEIDIKGHEFPNKPYGEIENKKVYPQGNYVTGSKVRGVITKIKNKKIELKKIEVLKKGENEISPFCDYFNVCGGCSFQNLTYDDQLKLKSDLLKNIISQKVKYNYFYENIIKSPLQYEYRNKMEFSFGNEVKDGPLSLGLHKKNSFHDVITVENCKLMDNDFRKILNLTLNYFSKKKISFYHRLEHKGYLRNLVIRKGEKTGEIGINLITTSQLDFNLGEWCNLILNEQYKNKIVSVIHTINDKLSDSVKSDNEIILYGNRDINENIFGLNFKISPYSFFQTNSLGVELLYGKILDYLNEINLDKNDKKIIFDLFSGTGTIGQIVSKNASYVYGIELIEEAVLKANESVKSNNINNCKFISGDVFEKINELDNQNIKPDILILDPPRAGVGIKTINKLCDYNVEKIIYVSCNPKTFIQDMEQFHERGYRVKKITPVDMFPQTPHLELIALLSKY